MFKPSTATGTIIGLLITIFALALGGGLVYQGLTMSVQLVQLLPLLVGAALVCLGLLFAYWTWCCHSLRYVLDQNALSIRWGNLEQVLPLASIERLMPAGQERVRVKGVSWPGHHAGRGEVWDLGKVLFYSAHRASSEVLYVGTAMETYAISVQDQIAFAQTVQSNQSSGPVSEQRQAVRRSGAATYSFWVDPVARALTVVLVGCFVAVLAYVADMYPDLAQNVTLRFPSLGGVERVADKSALLDIPKSAFGIMAMNLVLAALVHSWERMVGYVLLLAGIGVQVMLLVAAVVAVA
jgi:PH (Pleckstrin Homology) domain-containing protein